MRRVPGALKLQPGGYLQDPSFPALGPQLHRAQADRAQTNSVLARMIFQKGRTDACMSVLTGTGLAYHRHMQHLQLAPCSESAHYVAGKQLKPKHATDKGLSMQVSIFYFIFRMAGQRESKTIINCVTRAEDPSEQSHHLGHCGVVRFLQVRTKRAARFGARNLIRGQRGRGNFAM